MIMKRKHLINKIIPLLFMIMFSSCGRSEIIPVTDISLRGSWDVVNSEYAEDYYVFGYNGNDQRGLHYYSDFKQVRELSYFSYMLSDGLLTIRFDSQDNSIDELVYRVSMTNTEEIFMKSTIPGSADVRLKRKVIYYD